MWYNITLSKEVSLMSNDNNENNKIIGAISHAVENDPTTGYAVFIKWMLD